MSQIDLRRLAVLLGGFAYRFGNEVQLHDAIASVLASASVPFEREFVADKKNRFDFLIEGSIVIEVKVDGSFSEAISQVNRYCSLDVVDGVLLTATCPWARLGLPDRSLSAFHGKPVDMAWLRRRAL